MEKGKLIVIEGTDCSGKETQSEKLVERLNDENIATQYYSFPKYDTPTGKIVGLPYLGKSYLAENMIMDETACIFYDVSHKPYKEYDVEKIIKILSSIYQKTFNDAQVLLVKHALDTIVDRLKPNHIDLENRVMIALILEEVIESLSHGWFKEGAPEVDPKVASLFYAADRRYNLPEINAILDNGTNIILDRYTYSSMAHQGGKITDPDERKKMFKWIEALEFNFLELPESDARIFLHMPVEYAAILKKEREEKLDEHEKNPRHLYNAEKAYLELASMYHFDTIECVRDSHLGTPMKSDIKTPEEISDEVYSCVKKELKFK